MNFINLNCPPLPYFSLEADVFTAPAISMSAGRSEMSLILSMFTAELCISNRIRSALN